MADVTLFFVLAAVWWIVGTAGFIFWWTSEWDLESSDIGHGLMIGLFGGPTTWIMGYFIHRDETKPRVLIKKRKS